MEIVKTWRGMPIEKLSKEELIVAVNTLATMLHQQYESLAKLCELQRLRGGNF